jgi:hypothetical protein
MGIRHYRERLDADPAARAAHEAAVGRLVAEQARAIDEEVRAITERSRERIRALWHGGSRGEAPPAAPRLTVAKIRRWIERHADDAAALLLEASRRDPQLRERLKAEVL